MKAYLTRRYHFSASHRLHVSGCTDDWNREVFGKCNNPYGHGHNYVVAVTLAGEIDPATGMVCNLGDLDAFAREHLLGRFDLMNLNVVEPFLNLVPSTENLTIEIDRIFQAFPFAHLHGVLVEETGNNSFEYGDVVAG